MIGAIIGDIVGSAYEFDNVKTKAFALLTPCSDYTDDSLMTIAVADALMKARGRGSDFQEELVVAMMKIIISRVQSVKCQAKFMQSL